MEKHKIFRAAFCVVSAHHLYPLSSTTVYSFGYHKAERVGFLHQSTTKHIFALLKENTLFIIASFLLVSTVNTTARIFFIRGIWEIRKRGHSPEAHFIFRVGETPLQTTILKILFPCLINEKFGTAGQIPLFISNSLRHPNNTTNRINFCQRPESIIMRSTVPVLSFSERPCKKATGC